MMCWRNVAENDAKLHAVNTVFLAQIIIVGTQTGHGGYTSFESLLIPSPSESNVTPSSSSSSSSAAAAEAVDPRRLIATICYSSGTTGKPKGCVQTHFAYVAVSCQKK